MEYENSHPATRWNQEKFLNAKKTRNVLGLVAEQHGKIVGYLVYHSMGKFVQIPKLGFIPNGHDIQIPIKLTSRLVDIIENSNRISISIDIPVSDNSALMALQRVGFDIIDELISRYENTGEDAYRMEYRKPFIQIRELMDELNQLHRTVPLDVFTERTEHLLSVLEQDPQVESYYAERLKGQVQLAIKAHAPMKAIRGAIDILEALKDLPLNRDVGTHYSLLTARLDLMFYALAELTYTYRDLLELRSHYVSDRDNFIQREFDKVEKILRPLATKSDLAAYEVARFSDKLKQSQSAKTGLIERTDPVAPWRLPSLIRAVYAFPSAVKKTYYQARIKAAELTIKYYQSTPSTNCHDSFTELY